MMFIFFGMGIGTVCFQAGADPLEPDPENAANTAEASEEVKKTQKEAFRPEWVGAQQLWKRAATLGAPKEPEVRVVVERKPTTEEKDQVRILEDILSENKLQTAKLAEYGKLQ